MENDSSLNGLSNQKALDVEYHRKATETYDRQITDAFHYLYVYSLRPWIRNLVSDIPNAKVLDLGTGTGVVAVTLARFGAFVTGVDHSESMLSIARSRAEDLCIAERLSFEIGDREALRFEDKCFDAVTGL